MLSFLGVFIEKKMIRERAIAGERRRNSTEQCRELERVRAERRKDMNDVVK